MALLLFVIAYFNNFCPVLFLDRRVTTDGRACRMNREHDKQLFRFGFLGSRHFRTLNKPIQTTVGLQVSTVPAVRTAFRYGVVQRRKTYA